MKILFFSRNDALRERNEPTNHPTNTREHIIYFPVEVTDNVSILCHLSREYGREYTV